MREWISKDLQVFDDVLVNEITEFNEILKRDSYPAASVIANALEHRMVVKLCQQILNEMIQVFTFD